MFFSGKSDIGKRRATNQDSYSILSLPDGCFLCTICDGMGGANGGNVASEMACSVYTKYVSDNFITEDRNRASLLRKAVAAANTAVYKKAQSEETLRGMGTTLVSALIEKDGTAHVINVGDSRLYSIDSEQMRQITRDHSYVQYLVDMGQLTVKDAESASIRNIIIRSIGNEEESNPDLFTLELSPGSYILLCSDGLTNCVGNGIIEKEIHADTQEEMDLCAEKLIKLANEGGGTDNITVILGKIV